jgi:methionyl-tRNA synthetase
MSTVRGSSSQKEQNTETSGISGGAPVTARPDAHRSHATEGDTAPGKPTAGRRKIVATAALPYANGSIHIGHLVEYIQADIWVRFQRQRGHDAAFLCADDTHGTPIMIQAREKGISPEALIQAAYQEHTRDFADFEIAFDHYSSTHTEENRLLAEEFYTKMKAAGVIDTEAIEQLYCEHDKMFLPDRFVKGTCPKCGATDEYGDSCSKCGATYSPQELKDPHCALCGSTPVPRQSEHLFFRLRDFQSFLADYVPSHTNREVALKLNDWIQGELRSWNISRDEPYFGFKIPGTRDKYFYVWVDAPIGYLSAAQQWCQRTSRDFASIWRSGDTELYHFIGKDIVNFHLLFWPSMLKVAGFRLPNRVFVHGHLTVDGEKMSKSRGTSIKARTFLKHFPPSALRYYYASKLGPSIEDLDLSGPDLLAKINSELVGKITNLGSRGAQMLKKRLEGRLSAPDQKGRDLLLRLRSKSLDVAKFFEGREFARAIETVREMADDANRYFDDAAPWNLIKTDEEATRAVLSTTLNAFWIMTLCLTSVLPSYAERVRRLLRQDSLDWYLIDQDLSAGLVIEDYEHLATRLEEAQWQSVIKESTVSDAPAPKTSSSVASTSAKPPSANSGSALIDIQLFSQIDLRVGRIIEASAIPEADKLLKLRVDLGSLGTRQIFAGIKAAYQPDTLVNRLTVVVANLAPRQMKFGVSEGMVLAAGAGGAELYILSPDSGAKPGDRVK